MKSYSVHWINIFVIGIFLIILSDITIQQIIDPTYRTGSIRYCPRALIWYFTAYGLYKFLTTARKISFFEDGSIKLESLIRKVHINTIEIIAIRSNLMFVEIVTKRGSFFVSTLMEGISNIKEVLLSFVLNNIDSNELKKMMNRYKLFKIGFVIILIVIAVFVEWQQVQLRLK